MLNLRVKVKLVNTSISRGIPLEYNHVLIMALVSLIVIANGSAISIANAYSNYYELYKIEGNIRPHKTFEYHFQVSVNSYTVFSIGILGDQGIANSISLKILLDSNEYRNYTILRDRNELYGWGWLREGNYEIILTNNLDMEVSIRGYILMFRVYDPRLPQLVDKEVFGRENVPYPVGIVDYGVYIDEKSGQLGCYRYTAKEVIGVAYIDTIEGYSINPLKQYKMPGELSLQLNLVVEAGKVNSKKHVLWVQNIFVLKASNEALYYIIDDEVQNITVFGKNLVNPDIIKGKGKVISFADARIYQYHDKTWRLIKKSSKPVILMLHVKVHGNRIVFSHGYFVSRDIYFHQVHDVVTLTGYKNLDIVVDGCKFTGNPTDMEFVIGGRDAFYNVFKANNLDIRLLLLVKSNDTWTAPLSAWSIGKITMEKASNIESTPSNMATARLKRGSPIANQLWAVNESSKISLQQPTVYLITLRNGSSSLYLKPIQSVKDFEINGTYKLGSLSVVLIQEKEEVNVSYQYAAIFIVIIALVTIAKIYRQKRRM